MKKWQERAEKGLRSRFPYAVLALGLAASLGAWSVCVADANEVKGSEKPVELLQGLDGGHYEPYKTLVVREVQQALHERNEYAGKIDGRLDDDTMQAIKKFQDEHGIQASGVPSPMTRNRLLSAGGQASAAQHPMATDSAGTTSTATNPGASLSEQS